MTKNNVRYKKTKIEIEGKEYLLNFTLNAICELEDLYDSLQNAIDLLMKGNIKCVRAFLWAGLMEEHPELSIKDVGKMINIANLEELMVSLSGALTGDMPEVKEEEEGKN